MKLQLNKVSSFVENGVGVHTKINGKYPVYRRCFVSAVPYTLGLDQILYNFLVDKENSLLHIM